MTNSIQIFKDSVVLRSKACAFGVHDRKRVYFQCMRFECTASNTACVLSGTQSKCTSIDVLEPQCVSPQILDKCGYIRVAFKEYAGDHTCYQLPHFLAARLNTKLVQNQCLKFGISSQILQMVVEPVRASYGRFILRIICAFYQIYHDFIKRRTDIKN